MLTRTKTERNRKQKENAQSPPRVCGQSVGQQVGRRGLALVAADQGPKAEGLVQGRVAGLGQGTVALAPGQDGGDLKTDEKGLDQSLDKNRKADAGVLRNVRIQRNARSPRSRRNPVNVLLPETKLF